MSIPGKQRRLFQVAKELNVKTSTIVESLKAKGFKIVDTPMAEVTEEMHDQLLRQYTDDRHKSKEVDHTRGDFQSRPRFAETVDLDILEPLDIVPEPVPVKKPAPAPAFDYLEPEMDLIPQETPPPPPPTPAPVFVPPAPAPTPVQAAPPVVKEVERPAPKPPVVETPVVVSAPVPAPVPVPPAPVVEVKVEAPAPEPKVAPVAPATEAKPVVPVVPAVQPAAEAEDDGDDEEYEDEDEDISPEEKAEVIRAQREQLGGTRVLGKITIPSKNAPVDAASKKKKRKKKLSAAGEGVPSGENRPQTDRPAFGAGSAAPGAQPPRSGSGPFPKTTSDRPAGSGPFPQRQPGQTTFQGKTERQGPPGQPGTRTFQTSTGTARTAAPGTGPRVFAPGTSPGGTGPRRPGAPGAPGSTPGAPGSAPAPGSTSDRNKKKKDKDRRSDDESGESKPKSGLGLGTTGADAVKKRSKIRKRRREEAAQEAEAEELRNAENQNLLEVAEFISVSDLAEEIGVSAAQLISSAMKMGMFVSINQRLDAGSIELLAAEFNKEVSFIDAEDALDTEEDEIDDPADLKPRPPVVTVMGHVDHGKTSLLDYIKKSKVASGEAGGITQHIGAYSVPLEDGRLITFLDTPGHEAFTAMRARGAKATDIVILVVAADDSVMPQTIEAINHAQAAGVPIVVAVNKIDKPEANPEKIKKQLSEHNVLVEEWGGKTQCTLVSAKTGLGIDDLLASVLVEAELMELKANPDRLASGVVLEARVDKGKGTVATILVQNGTIRVGDDFVAGQFAGRIRALENEKGERIESAGPAMPAVATGFDGIPQAGDKVVVTEDERTAKNISIQRQQIKREQDMRRVKHMTLDDLSRRMALGSVSQLNIIVKGDVDGSIEALSGSLQKLSTEEVQIKIIHTGVGAISESDVLLASASDAIIIGFQVRPSANARKLAEAEQIDLRLFSIIYDALDAVKDAMEGMLSPELSEKILCTVQVRETFKVPSIGTIAGCYVQEGKINRNNKIRLIRDGIVVFTGELHSLKRFKDDVREVAAGFECGIGIHNYNNIEVGDLIEAFEVVETKRKLVTPGTN